MDENKEFTIPQEEPENIPTPEHAQAEQSFTEDKPMTEVSEEISEMPTDMVQEESPEETGEENLEITIEETPEEKAEAVHEEEAAGLPQPEQSTAYHGIGIGHRESPYENAPYVMNHRQEPYRPRNQAVHQPETPVTAKAKKGGFLRKLLAWVAATVLVAGSCGITAGLVNSHWENRTAAMEQEFEGQLQDLRKQIDSLTSVNAGNSLSGTVAVAGGMTAAQVYAQNVSSVVLIEATVTADLYGQTAAGVSTGSGFILSDDGYVLTNYHVVEGATSVEVVLHDGTVYTAALVGYDRTNDIAVLKVEARGLNPVVLGSSDALIVGDQVVAIGNPLGELTATLTVGYVSAKERMINTDGTIITMIQTDAAINSGNSGGPLFNMKGEVVGITTAKYSGASSSGATIEGIGFAIPMDDVMEEIEQLIHFGYIKSAYLGVMVQNMDPAVGSVYGLPVGAYVAGVEPGYCAQKAGIQAKDIILAVDDQQVENINDLTRILREYEPGDRVSIKIYRAGQVLDLPVVLDERPASAG